MSVKSYIKEIPVGNVPVIDRAECVRQYNRARDAYHAQKSAGLGESATHLLAITDQLREQLDLSVFPTIAKEFTLPLVMVRGVTTFDTTGWAKTTFGLQRKPPRVALAQLSEGSSRIRINTNFFGRIEHWAPIPTIPMAVTELAKRIKARQDNAEFHLLFEPNWKSERKPFDPALLTRVPGMPEDHYYLIHIWGGDQDVIAPHISEAK